MTDIDSFNYLKEGVAKDLVLKLMEDYGCSIFCALDILYGSKTYKKICNEKTGLYYQESLYLYSFLKNEVETGKMV